VIRAASFPLAVAIGAAPFVAVLQSKALAPVALVALLLSVIAHRRAHGAWPWPRGVALAAGAALGLWGALSALWAPEPARALTDGLSLAGLSLLAGAAARAASEDDEAARRLLGRALFWGLLAGCAAALLDLASGHALRMGVRGLTERPFGIEFGLKPAASFFAMLLPLLALAPLPRWVRLVALASGTVSVLILPGDSAKIAAVLGVALLAAGALAPRLAARATALALAAALLLGPALIGKVLDRRVLPVDTLPMSATHRLLIWDFVEARIAERPWLGWGLEASRAIPGGRDAPKPEALTRIGLVDPWRREFLSGPTIQSLPLHPHNGALQIRLELGWPGVLLAGALLAALGFAAASRARPEALAGALAAAFVTGMLSFGAWQGWWLASQALALAVAAGLSARPRG
jgi:O-antigen ligase